jgi:hypothetical protein
MRRIPRRSKGYDNKKKKSAMDGNGSAFKIWVNTNQRAFPKE